MKVLQLIHNLKREGAQSVVACLAQHFSTGTESVVCAWKNLGPLADDLQKQGIKVISPPSNNPIKAGLWLRRYLTEEKVDIVHAHMSDSASIAFIACCFAKTPFLISFHSNRIMPKYSGIKHSLYGAIFNLAVKHSEANIAVSESVHKLVKRELKGYVKNLRLITNGVPVTQNNSFQTNLEIKLCNIDRQPKILAVGRLINIKGFEQLIKALPSILKQIPHLQLTILGEGEERANLEQLCKTLKLEHHVQMPGLVSDVQEWHNKHEIFISTSHYEGLPIAAAEAMGSGLPIIASDVPGNYDLIQHKVNGLTYELNNIDMLGKTVVLLLNNKKLYQELATEGYLTCKKNYSAASMTTKHEALYSSILA